MPPDTPLYLVIDGIAYRPAALQALGVAVAERHHPQHGAGRGRRCGRPWCCRGRRGGPLHTDAVEGDGALRAACLFPDKLLDGRVRAGQAHELPGTHGRGHGAQQHPISVHLQPLARDRPAHGEREAGAQIGAGVAVIDPLAERWEENLRAIAAQVRQALERPGGRNP